jgi:hypothetical protein
MLFGGKGGSAVSVFGKAAISCSRKLLNSEYLFEAEHLIFDFQTIIKPLSDDHRTSLQ